MTLDIGKFYLEHMNNYENLILQLPLLIAGGPVQLYLFLNNIWLFRFPKYKSNYKKMPGIIKKKLDAL